MLLAIILNEASLDLDRHIAAADNIINKLGNPDLSDDFGFDLDDPNEIRNEIPHEVMEAVNNGELDLNVVLTVGNDILEPFIVGLHGIHREGGDQAIHSGQLVVFEGQTANLGRTDG